MGETQQRHRLLIVGIEHHNQFIHSAIELLEKKLPPRIKKVGLELGEMGLKLMTRMAEKRRRPFGNSTATFWFNLIRFLQKKGIQIVPIDPVMDSLSFTEILKTVRGDTRAKERELEMAKEIVENELETVIVGRAHVPNLYAHFKKIGWSVRATQTKNMRWHRTKKFFREQHGIPRPKAKGKTRKV